MKAGTVIAITSGKGGTGKTAVTAGVGAALAAPDRPVLCLDADLTLRNLDLCLGLSDRAVLDFSDVLTGACTLDAALVPHPGRPGLFLLAAPPFCRAEEIDEQAFHALLQELRTRFSFCLIDCPAGLGADFHLAAAQADRALIVATGDASSLRDGQRAAQELRALGVQRLHLIVNRIRVRLLRRMTLTIDDAMDLLGVPLLGIVPEEDAVLLANNRGEMLPVRRRGAGRAYQNIARRLCGEQVPLLKI